MTWESHQTDAMIHGPGGYRYLDFLRVGGPLKALLTVVAAILIPLSWPS